MPALVLLTLLLTQPAAPPQAASFAAAGETHLKRATTTTARPLDEYQSAHTNFDSAYLVDGSTVYLCRALAVADLALRTVTFSDDQERLFWEETRRDDLERLQHDAATTGRANCRFDPTGKPAAPKVALAPHTDLPARPVSPATPTHMGAIDHTPPLPSPEQRKRYRTHTIAGAVLTAAGIGLTGAVTGLAVVMVQRRDEMKGLNRLAYNEGREFTGEENRRFLDMAEDYVRGRGAAIGVSVAAVASLSSGIALLATRKRADPRSYAFHPYGGAQGVGAVLRLRF